MFSRAFGVLFVLGDLVNFPVQTGRKERIKHPELYDFRKPAHIPRGSSSWQVLWGIIGRPLDSWSQPRVDCFCFSSSVNRRNVAGPLLCSQQASYSCGPRSALKITPHCTLPLCYQLIAWPCSRCYAACHQKLASAALWENWQLSWIWSLNVISLVSGWSKDLPWLQTSCLIFINCALQFKACIST